MVDVGLTHIALVASDLDRSIAFYARYAGMEVVHRRSGDAGSGDVVWLSDGTRAFVIVLIERPDVGAPLGPLAHLGVACESRAIVDERCAWARADGVLRYGPIELPWPVGYFALLADPDGHTLELSFGQEVEMTVETSRTGARESHLSHAPQQTDDTDGSR